MKLFKFIHISDLHLNLKDVDFTLKDIEEKNKLNLKIFDEVIEKCFADDVNLLLISGDLFDNNDIKTELYNHIVSQLESIPNTTVVISPGNHDSIENMYFYKYSMLPKNTYIFKNDYLESFELNDEVNIIGANNNYILNRESIEKIIDGKKSNILILHTPFNGTPSLKENEEVLNIVDGLALDYCAFGHKHEFNGFDSIGRCVIGTVGAPYGIEDYHGNRGYIIGTIEDGYLEVSFNITVKANRQ